MALPPSSYTRGYRIPKRMWSAEEELAVTAYIRLSTAAKHAG